MKPSASLVHTLFCFSRDTVVHNLKLLFTGAKIVLFSVRLGFLGIIRRIGFTARRVAVVLHAGCSITRFRIFPLR